MRNVRDVVTDNHGDAALSDSLTINNAKFVHRVAEHLGYISLRNTCTLL